MPASSRGRRPRQIRLFPGFCVPLQFSDGMAIKRQVSPHQRCVTRGAEGVALLGSRLNAVCCSGRAVTSTGTSEQMV